MIWRLILFISVLSYFYLGSGWYEPTRLILQGQTVSSNSLLRVQWDSGEGFNGYEQREFRPAIQPLDEQHTNQLILGANGERNPASLSKKVVCTAIIIDGEPFDLASLQQDISYSNGGLEFSPGETLLLTVRATAHIGVKFQTNNHSGIALLSLNGVAAEHDLYVANVEAKYKQFDYWMLLPDGSFRVEMEMPRYDIHELKFLNGNIDKPVQLIAAGIHGDGKILDLMQDQPISLGNARFFDVLESFRSHYHPFQFFLQVCFALITTWLVSSIVQLYVKLGGVRASFIQENRFIFWILFCFSCAIFGVWLVAFWPGVMSVDSLKVWQAAILPDVYLNDHPVLNVLLYKYLYQLWGNPAIVAVAQVILMALLFSWFGFWLYQQGVSNFLLLPWFLLGVCAVPVGCYNVMLWKDIPFALLVVFWACTLVKLYRERQNGSLFWTGQKIVALFLLGLALGLIRHNGIVYLVILPSMFVFLRIVPTKKVLIGLSIIISTGIIGWTALQYIKNVPGLDFIAQQIRHYTVDRSVQNIVKNPDRLVRDYIKIFDFNQKQQKWDKFHYYFNDRYAYSFLLHSGWWQFYPYQKETITFPWLRKTLMKVYDKSYHEPWVWLSWNPVWLLTLLPVVTLLFWWFPHTAILGVVILGGALPLVYLRIFNWRYYYFLYLGLLFILPLISLDLPRRKLSQVTH